VGSEPRSQKVFSRCFGLDIERLSAEHILCNLSKSSLNAFTCSLVRCVMNIDFTGYFSFNSLLRVNVPSLLISEIYSVNGSVNITERF
jgi:hypothetical protein